MARRPAPRKRKTRDPFLHPRALIQPRLYRRLDSAAYLNISGAQLDLLRTCPDFPRPLTLPSTRNPSGGSRIPLWDRADLDRWIERQKGAGDGA